MHSRVSFEIIHRPHCRLIEKELGVVHIRKDLANASLVLELRLAHFDKVHVGTDVRSQVSYRGVGFVLFIKNPMDGCSPYIFISSYYIGNEGRFKVFEKSDL